MHRSGSGVLMVVATLLTADAPSRRSRALNFIGMVLVIMGISDIQIVVVTVLIFNVVLGRRMVGFSRSIPNRTRLRSRGCRRR
jgi:hypothetical protein